MRLHHLRVTAFGPFADTVDVDFDALGEPGLFLLAGPTGAGKTSVLDAVCFALYGEVPGDRNAARRLRSDHAAPGEAPRVELEATISGRRFRVVRSPAWRRPKKRGQGTTVQQASVTLMERLCGQWHPLSSRLDETGQLLTRSLGMNLTQFCQVALLPQGRFQEFLRARSEERHQLLQQLFRTRRFEDVERWLRERRSTLRDRSAQLAEQVAVLVNRASEVADVPVPQEWDVGALEETVDDGRLDGWLEDLQAAAAARRAGASEGLVRARTGEDSARQALAAGRRVTELQKRHLRAAAERTALENQSADRATDRRSLDAARRAAGVVALAETVRRASTASRDAADRAGRHRRAAAAVLGGHGFAVDVATLEAARAAALEGESRVRALVPRQAELARMRTRAAERETRLNTLRDEATVLAGRSSSLPARIDHGRGEQQAAARAAAVLGAAKERVAELRSRCGAAVRLPGLREQLEAARADLAAASVAVLSAKEAWLGVREARIDGMAAELAGALVAGDSCPVCGSAEHPRPAPTPTGAPDAAAERTARRRLDDAEIAAQAHDGRVRDLVTGLALAEQAAGAGPEAQPAALQVAEAELAELAAVAGRLGAATAALTEAETARQTLAERLQRCRERVAEEEGAASAARVAADDVAAELAGELADGEEETDLATLADHHAATAATLAHALVALTDARRADEHLTECREHAAREARAAGFADAEDALAAARSPADLTELAHRVAAYDERLAVTAAVLADPDLVAAAGLPAPDVDDLDREHRAAAGRLAAATADHRLAAARAERLDRLRKGLQEAVRAWTPVRQELALTAGLSSFVDGRSPDNRLQMRLSAFVLAARLRQVVAAANERLARMSDRRYSLEHTAERSSGETRGGLSIRVRDDWTGEARETATLSGGESFVVALALALGLADVIAQEAGGTCLDTLFVDEGFGSLDADTLEDVMATLDTLRDGGRTVGVVSHVVEMVDRIPTRLQVDKGRRGSTVRLVRAG